MLTHYFKPIFALNTCVAKEALQHAKIVLLGATYSNGNVAVFEVITVEYRRVLLKAFASICFLYDCYG